MECQISNIVIEKPRKTDKKEKKKKREVKLARKVDCRPLADQIFFPNSSVSCEDTPIVALDCEMVETDRWGEGLARISIVNYYGHVLLDKYVIPEGNVTNYRTWVSGVTPQKLLPENGAIPMKKAQKKAFRILKGKILVGHSINHDF